MRFCTNCGHRLGVGRYCTNCGSRVPVAPVADPTAARYPPYADTGQLPTAPAPPPPAPTAGLPPVSPPTTAPPYAVAPAPPSRRSVAPWLVGLLAIAVLVVGGAVLLLASSGDDDTSSSRGGAGHGDRSPGSAGPASGPAKGPSSLLQPARVSVPGTAPASVDQDGNRVTFGAGNMLDADPRTSWRMTGDGAGAVITFTFDHAMTVTRVGLINGYAKTDPPHDWYLGNRRISAVTWMFDDGTEITQELDADRTVQTVPVSAGATTRVELRIVEVTQPGHGPDGRDFTAISDVEISGHA